MNLFSLSGLIIGLPCLVLGIFTLLKSQRRLHYIWAIFSFSVATWGFGSYIIGLSSNPDWAVNFWRLAYVGVILIPATLINFVFEFLNLAKNKLVGFFTWVIYAITAIFLFLNIFTSLFIDQLRLVFGQFYYLTEPSVVYSLFVVWFFGLVIICHLLLIQSYQKKLWINQGSNKIYHICHGRRFFRWSIRFFACL